MSKIEEKLNVEFINSMIERTRVEVIDRRENNIKIVQLLGEFFEANPQIRFEQGLYVMLNDYIKFSRESSETLRILENYKERNKEQFIKKEEEK